MRPASEDGGAGGSDFPGRSGGWACHRASERISRGGHQDVYKRQELEQAITDRESISAGRNERGFIPVAEGDKLESSSQVVVPIISAGDAIGSVVLLGKTTGNKMGEAEQKLAMAASLFLGKQMEQ